MTPLQIAVEALMDIAAGRAELDDWGDYNPQRIARAALHKRKLNKQMVYALVLIYRELHEKNEWLHVPSYLHKTAATGPTVRGGDWAKLVHWGLITAKAGERADGSKRVGFYRLTDKGRAFVESKIKVPKHVFLYAERFVGTSSEMVSILDASKAFFDYRELMDG
jgi:hypothetical protein